MSICPLMNVMRFLSGILMFCGVRVSCAWSDSIYMLAFEEV